MEKAAAKPPLPHDLILESRSKLTVTGVQRVLHCSAESAALETGKGILHLSGAQISMQTLDLEAGEAKLTGGSMGWSIPPPAQPAASGTGCCADGAGAAARPALAGSRRLCYAGRCPWRGAGVSAGAGQGGFCAGRAAFWCGAAGVPELRRRVQRRRGAAVVHGVGSLCSALCTAGVLGIPLRALGRGIGAVLRLPGRILHRFAVQPLCRRRAAAKTARKLRRNAERTAKKSKKNLPNRRALLYNSNVSK